jgi:hypothetical protein
VLRPGDVAALNATDPAKVAGIVAAYSMGMDLPAPVAVRWRRRWWALSGSHRFAALARLVAAREWSLADAAERAIWLDGAALAADDDAGEVRHALDRLRDLCLASAHGDPVPLGEYWTILASLAPWLPSDAQLALRDA